MSLPNTHKALVLSSFKDPLDISVSLVDTPSLSAGSAIVRVLSAGIASYLKEVYSGKLPYPMKLPLTPGGGAIGRVAAVGPDAVSLQVGQLVVVHIHVRARDDPAASILQGLFGAGPAEKLMSEEWRHGSYAEYFKAPLENIFPLDEDALINRMGYKINDLTYIPTLMVPFGGLAEEIDLKPGESIVVAPATGSFGGAAVTMALAMGALVIAAGRNESQLKTMENVLGAAYGGRLRYVKLTGDVQQDAEALQKASPGGKGLDAYIDFSPPQAANSTHFKSCLLALKTYGRAAFMGGIREDVNIPYMLLMLKSLQIRGKFMYHRASVTRLIGMIECGLVKLGDASGVQVVGTYPLEEYEAALDAAAESTGFGKSVVFTP